MLKIQNSLDWPNIETELLKLGRMLPMFETDIKRFRNHLREMVTELGNLEVRVRATHSKSATEDCIRQVNKINAELREIQKFHLMSVMSNS